MKNEDLLLSKIDKLDDRLDKIDIHLAEYNTQLKIHIKRTEILEQDVKPISEHVSMMKGAGKLIGIIGMTAAAILTLVRLTDIV